MNRSNKVRVSHVVMLVWLACLFRSGLCFLRQTHQNAALKLKVSILLTSLAARVSSKQDELLRVYTGYDEVI